MPGTRRDILASPFYPLAGGPIPGLLQTRMRVPPGPSHPGTGDATDPNSESALDVPSNPPESASGDGHNQLGCETNILALRWASPPSRRALLEPSPPPVKPPRPEITLPNPP